MGSDQTSLTVGSLHKLLALSSADPGSDAELLGRFAANQDEAAFAALVERHGAMVLRVCRRTLECAEDAEDVCQATFLVLARKAASIRQRHSLASWLFGVAMRIARKLQSQQRRRKVVAQPAVLAQPTVTRDEPSWREALAILDEELLRLPEKYRAPLLLCFLENLSRSEAALKLGLRANQLRSRLDYGRELFRARLVRRGVMLPAGMLTGILVSQARAEPAYLASVAKAACLSVSGQRIPVGLVSPRAVTLSKGVFEPMFAMKAKLLSLGLIMTGLGVALSAAIRSDGGATPLDAPIASAQQPVTPPFVQPPQSTVPSGPPVVPSPQPDAPAMLPVAPPPHLGASATSNLDKHLAAWEEAVAKVTNIRAEISLTRTDNVFKKETQYDGVALLMKPNYAIMRLNRLNSANDKADYEATICEGKSLYVYNGLKKTMTEHKIPASITKPVAGQNNLLLDLLVGMKANEAKARFDISILKEDANFVYLDLKPKSDNDKWDFQQLRVALFNPKTPSPYLPCKVTKVKPNGDMETWDFSKHQLNIRGVDEGTFKYVKVPGFKEEKATEPPR